MPLRVSRAPRCKLCSNHANAARSACSASRCPFSHSTSLPRALAGTIAASLTDDVDGAERGGGGGCGSASGTCGASCAAAGGAAPLRAVWPAVALCLGGQARATTLGGRAASDGARRTPCFEGVRLCCCGLPRALSGAAAAGAGASTAAKRAAVASSASSFSSSFSREARVSTSAAGKKAAGAAGTKAAGARAAVARGGAKGPAAAGGAAVPRAGAEGPAAAGGARARIADHTSEGESAALGGKTLYGFRSKGMKKKSRGLL